jgi:hypothetical protein
MTQDVTSSASRLPKEPARIEFRFKSKAAAATKVTIVDLAIIFTREAVGSISIHMPLPMIDALSAVQVALMVKGLFIDFVYPKSCLVTSCSFAMTRDDCTLVALQTFLKVYITRV